MTFSATKYFLHVAPPPNPPHQIHLLEGLINNRSIRICFLNENTCQMLFFEGSIEDVRGYYDVKDSYIPDCIRYIPGVINLEHPETQRSLSIQTIKRGEPATVELLRETEDDVVDYCDIPYEFFDQIYAKLQEVLEENNNILNTL